MGSRRDFLKAGLGTGALWLLAACSGAAPPAAPPAAAPAPKPTSAPAKDAPAAQAAATTAPAAAAAKQGGTLTVARSSLPAALSERQSGAEVVSLLLNIGDPLTTQDAETGKVLPKLAESWKNIDPTTWEFKLRSGIRFHNGEPFNSEAVKFTYDRALDIKNNFSRRSRLALVTAVEPADELTVRIKTSAPFPLLPFGVSQIPIQPPRYFAEVGEAGYEQKPVGTGPFKVTEWTPNQQVVFETNKSYWDSPAKFDKLVWKYIPEASTRVSALLAGEVDIINNIPVDVLPTIKTATTNVASGNLAAGLIITFDTLTQGPLQNLKVRQAIDMAIDRKAIFNLYQGYGAILDGQLTTKGTIGYNPNLKPTAYDPDGAKRLLAEAGFANGFSLVFSGASGAYIADRDIVLAIAAQLGKVGIQVQPNLMEPATLSQQRAAKQLKDMYAVVWYNLGDAENAIIWYESSNPIAISRFPEFDETLNRARTELDPAAREKLLQEAAALQNKDLPCSFLLQLPLLYGFNKRVSGFKVRLEDYMIDLNRVSVG